MHYIGDLFNILAANTRVIAFYLRIGRYDITFRPMNGDAKTRILDALVGWRAKLVAGFSSVVGFWSFFETVGFDSSAARIMQILMSIVITLVLFSFAVGYVLSREKVAKGPVWWAVSIASLVLLLALILAINPAEKLLRSFGYTETNLCKLNTECTAWVFLDDIDYGTLPIKPETISLSDSALLINGNATSEEDFCPAQFEGENKVVLSKDHVVFFWEDHRKTLTGSDPILRGLAYEPDINTVVDQCDDIKSDSCLIRREARLFAGNSVRVIGCTSYGSLTTSYSPTWLKIRDGNFNTSGGFQ